MTERETTRSRGELLDEAAIQSEQLQALTRLLAEPAVPAALDNLTAACREAVAGLVERLATDLYDLICEAQTANDTEGRT
ncbi:hypothetical protein [Paraburkholderia adhaesiva]|uniref:hypothetical protein n=1 Tax=Paraburkholderia adhaesiva TaxID=2883244 RepID=UPI001F20F66A|nr:hypothetical protein [Paraburkholderia adhaesiva]